MTKKLVASVAAGALFAGVSVFAPMSFAQETPKPNTMEVKPVDGAMDPSGAANYLTQQAADQISASTYVGQSVYNASDESIGEINDVIFTKGGTVAAAVIGVGGFLGIGEKNVAVPLDAITVSETQDAGGLKLTTQETADTLKNAPEFKTKAQQMAERDNNALDTSTTSSTTGNTTAPANTMAPANNMAPAPATQPTTNN